ncbi:translation initiation factor IF-2 [Actinomadura alba]|uniref:Translation initiation factor IF-2 n=1 Tax=Actinomadura alba TaxID=406431 RepID=A0ABR7LPD9_9ACTN|nr:translation initiation factor IF-2 [Actinomadura alba]MBC6466712.1 translation initiation factor IF-2 [Actinomadura alba]
MRRTMIAALVITALAAGACGTDRAEAAAEESARGNSRKISNAMYGTRLVKADDIAHHVADLEGVEVLKVSSDTTDGTEGVRVVIRVVGAGFRGEGWFRQSGRVTVTRCFELTFGRGWVEWDTVPPRVCCPAGTPPRFSPWLEPPPIPVERIERALPKVNELPSGRGVEEKDVRAAIAKLNLHPAIRIEIETESDFAAGVAFSVDPSHPGAAFDCVLASVKPGETKVWTPSRTRRMPGEKNCDAHDALRPTPTPS